jgi:Chaperone of endosialidase
MKNRHTIPARILLALGCFALSPASQAIMPAPDGGYPGQNTAEGDHALNSLTTGTSNTAIGWRALFLSTDGYENTANGARALYHTTGSAGNTATGFQALFNDTEGSGNTANGVNALAHNTTGLSNTAVGIQALLGNTSGDFNTAIGLDALLKNTTGHENIALGDDAGANLTTGSFNIDIGNLGATGESRTIRIGNASVQNATFIAGIRGATTSGGLAVYVNSDGKLGTLTSSLRFKDEIKPMDKASEAILALRPVTFRYKKEIDPQGIPQFGLVAEEVEKINPALVARDAEGKVYTVRYEAVNAMLLNEFLKEHRTVQEQKATISELKNGIAALAAQLKEQAAQIQKVSAQVQVTRPVSKMALNR